MKTLKKYFPLTFIIILMIFSLLNNYNARLISDVYKYNLYKQLFFYVIGFIIIFFFSKIKVKRFFSFHYLYYVISVLLLILVLFFGKNVNGATAWFDFKIISFQPSEFMKFTLAISLAKITKDFNNSKNKNDLLHLTKLAILTIIPSILVFIEPDTGAIIFYFLTFLVAFFLSKVKKRWFVIFAVTFFSVCSFFIYIYFFNQDLLIDLIGTSFFYRVDRLTNLTDNYQINNSLTLIGASSFFGKGINSTSLYIPEAPTDFMFAYNFGNFGLFGALVVLLTYALLIFSLIKGIKKSQNKVFSYIFITTLLFGIFYNILMNIGILPIMGIVLPFLSYGGSALLIYFLFLGLYFKIC